MNTPQGVARSGFGLPAAIKSSGCPGAIDNRQPIREAGGRQLVARVLQIDVVRNNQQSYEMSFPRKRESRK
jgi:hypothetical protein